LSYEGEGFDFDKDPWLVQNEGRVGQKEWVSRYGTPAGFDEYEDHMKKKRSLSPAGIHKGRKPKRMVGKRHARSETNMRGPGEMREGGGKASNSRQETQGSISIERVEKDSFDKSQGWRKKRSENELPPDAYLTQDERFPTPGNKSLTAGAGGETRAKARNRRDTFYRQQQLAAMSPEERQAFLTEELSKKGEEHYAYGDGMATGGGRTSTIEVSQEESHNEISIQCDERDPEFVYSTSTYNRLSVYHDPVPVMEKVTGWADLSRVIVDRDRSGPQFRYGTDPSVAQPEGTSTEGTSPSEMYYYEGVNPQLTLSYNNGIATKGSKKKGGKGRDKGFENDPDADDSPPNTARSDVSIATQFRREVEADLMGQGFSVGKGEKKATATKAPTNFLEMSAAEQAAALQRMSSKDRAAAMAGMSLEDRANAFMALPDAMKLEVLSEMSRQETASLLQAFSYPEIESVLAIMSPANAADALRMMSTKDVVQVLELMTDGIRIPILENMSPKERAMAIDAMSSAMREECLSNMSPEGRVSTLAHSEVQHTETRVSDLDDEHVDILPSDNLSVNNDVSGVHGFHDDEKLVNNHGIESHHVFESHDSQMRVGSDRVESYDRADPHGSHDRADPHDYHVSHVSHRSQDKVGAQETHKRVSSVQARVGAHETCEQELLVPQLTLPSSNTPEACS